MIWRDYIDNLTRSLKCANLGVFQKKTDVDVSFQFYFKPFFCFCDISSSSQWWFKEQKAVTMFY